MKRMGNGYLIVFEGIDGSGKTTQSKKLLDFLTTRGVDCAWFREPGDSTAGKKIRELAMNETHLAPEDELELFMADRRENVSSNLLPHLAAGRVVLLDRYYFSSACYQGARGLDMDNILKLHQNFAPSPDIALYIDVDVEVALQRISTNRGQRAVRFETETFLKKVRDKYLDLCRQGLLVKIDGNRNEASVWQDVKQTCEDSLSLRR